MKDFEVLERLPITLFQNVDFGFEEKCNKTFHYANNTVLFTDSDITIC